MATEATLTGATPARVAMIGVSDFDGVLRGKHVLGEDLSGQDKVIKFSEAVLAWDCSDRVIPISFTQQPLSAFGDADLRILSATGRSVSDLGNQHLYLAEFAGAHENICPRGVLRKVLRRAADLGYRCAVGFEFEFMLFKESADTIEDKPFSEWAPLTRGPFGYSIMRSVSQHELFDEILALCEKARIPLSGLHFETGPGVVEASLRHCDALEAADRATIFKSIIKAWAQRRGMMATFMAKVSEDWPGQSGHIHISMSSDGQNAFHDSNAAGNLSKLMRQFIAGQLNYMNEFCVLAAPNFNSYKRLVPGYWAPICPSWGVDNRSCAVRAILGEPSVHRLEYRLAGADVNPYLALACAIGSGILGVETGVALPASIAGDASVEMTARLPQSLSEATSRFAQSAAANEIFGERFVEAFSCSRRWEWDAVQNRVTDFERRRYFEII
ncbi:MULTISPECIES: glutamine synthetase family protein [Bradyrhizobium]|uniref:glutamine synthetase family protein n=1 Tax=Bradyrhizobium TaxID=374 RepID=UPI00155ECCC2|nr:MULTISPECIES: glutamine synthetase [Bradyrhizobium]MDD1523518.1 glutamine synthetase [Bradyrhizobium sp. WBAH30]MDD1547603.1 glutamine synthetase [Bradyrhizobium sp. WBAH41]MDD1561238.1 glutamine synthetase [Bradyrhizobium sp. WBAH23]MDD1568719.1 glutamine synthetase [Bradyrhizobium sp. WBAH33]MDD1594694.1 glutamine synthetase [Bradyrhizobium sp. WBAH42]